MQKFLSAILILMLTFSGIHTTTFAVNNTETAKNTEESTAKSNRKKTEEDIKKAKEAETKTEKKQDEKTTKESETKGDSAKDETKSDNTLSEGPEIQSEAAILVNSNTGKILFEKNSHKRMFPASTTKIMTAYLALSRLDLSSEITVSKTAIDIPSDSSQMGLLTGEKLTAETLLYSLMIQSANDAANVLAESVSGSIPAFVDLMNETASELGMSNTHYVNPHGYHDENHYTTAHDMAIIAQKAMEIPKFAEIVSTTSLKIPPTNKYKEERIFSTRNWLINKRASLSYQYAFANGIKTGHTQAAGYCLVGSAERSGMSLITVVFKAPENNHERVYTDTKNMFEYAYKNYRIRTVLKADDLASTCNVKWARGKSHLVLNANKDVKTLLPRDEYIPELLTSEINVYDNIVAPIEEGQELGEIKYYYDKQEVAVAKLYAANGVSKSYIKQFFSYLLSLPFLIVLGIIVAYILTMRFKAMRRAARVRQIKRRNQRR